MNPFFWRALMPMILMALQTVTATQFSSYILAPPQRTIRPTSIHSTTGNVTTVLKTPDDGKSSLFDIITFGPNSSVTFDFGLNVGGPVRFNVSSVSSPDQILAVSFTESPLYISPYLCDGGFGDWDDPLSFEIPQPGGYAADNEHQRGGYRYATLWLNGTGVATVTDFWVTFTPSPELSDLREYPGWFNSDSEKLNRVWYAGAYTNQLCTADPKYGNTLFIGGHNWYTNYTIANGSSVIMDGAKRDRLVWPGDIIIAAPSIMVSTNSMDGTKNAIDSIFVLQDSEGRLPTSGKPFSTMTPSFFFSFNYHLYTLQNLYTYYMYTGDEDYVTSYWGQFKNAIAYSLSTIDKTGMANVTGANDWGRFGMGGHNIEANAVLYHTLSLAIEIAEVVNDTSKVEEWRVTMSTIKTTINEVLWDPSQNLFFDNDTIQTNASVRPQDGNVWAVLADVVSEERAAAISAALMKRWVKPYGAPAPEAGITVSPFITGLELKAHILAGFPERAIDLMEWMWADFMLDDPRMTNSTLVEGYSIDGRIHYPPYSDVDQRISHAHGWSSAPTSVLTFDIAGLQMASPGGKTWLIHPQIGGLNRVTAGYKTPSGNMSVSWEKVNGYLTGSFETPEGTSGTLILPRQDDKVVVSSGAGQVSPSEKTASTVIYSNLAGGKYVVQLEG